VCGTPGLWSLTCWVFTADNIYLHFDYKLYYFAAKFSVMDKTGQIEIRVSGLNGDLELKPDNYDIRDIIGLLENAESLLCPNDRNRPVISYEILSGSVRHVFKTAMQSVIAFNAVIGQINQAKSIDSLDKKTATAIENLQNVSLKRNCTFEISTSLDNTNKIKLNAETAYFRKENIWADAEFYFYGKITNAGGKDKANIHIVTEEYGVIIIQIPIDFLKQYEGNILYRDMGIYATGKQNLHTGEIDTSSLVFVNWVNYRPKYDENYLNGLQEQAQKWIKDIDTDEWMNMMRGRV
jgi:hypothetical protein